MEQLYGRFIAFDNYTPFHFIGRKNVVITAEDKNLIAALIRDDRSALSELFRKYHTALCRVSFRILNDNDEAKDVAQSVFVKLWQNRKDLNINYSLEAYLRKAAINTAFNRVESKKKFTSLNLQKSPVPKKGEQTVENQQGVDELQSQIDVAIRQLPPRTRAVFTLIRFEGMSYKEVAESLEISSKAVEKEMLKALRILRQLLRDYLPFFLLSAVNSGQFSFFFD